MSTVAQVFVYGTLLSGCHNHSLLKTARKVGDAVLQGYTLVAAFDTLGFPVAVPRGAIGERDSFGAFVVGEVYAVDSATLARLDRLEGVPRHYQRKTERVLVMIPDSDETTGMQLVTPADVYMQASADGRPVIGPSWRSAKLGYALHETLLELRLPDIDLILGNR